MKIWHLSDTHSLHKQLPKVYAGDYDMVIHSGDFSDFASTANKNYYNNEPEVRAFIDWFGELPIEHKICIGGNHDKSIEKNLVKKKDFTDHDIIYLENDEVVIEGLKIWGSPITPTFNKDWAWNRDRDRIHKIWNLIPEDTDILVVHGPPKGILDISFNRAGEMESCGCSNLRKRINALPNLKAVLFGHIHNCKNHMFNAGVLKLSNNSTLFSNAACVVDGDFDNGLKYHGNTLIL